MEALACVTMEDFDAAGRGAVHVRDNLLFFKCPGCGRDAAVRAKAPGVASPNIEVLGYPGRVTLSAPVKHTAILLGGRRCNWHGWLREGVWLEAH